MALLEVKELKVHFPVAGRMFSRTRAFVRAVDGVGFELHAGETIGLVGESGCGKTTLGRAIARLVEPTSGSVWLEGVNLAELSEGQLRRRRREFQMIFQDPYSSLNPKMTVGQIIGEALEIHHLADSAAERQSRVAELLATVGLESGHAHRYPHEFSGGQRQRIGIARALAVEPKLVICDEPVSALDVSVQAQIVNLLQDLQRTRGVAYLFIAHDLAVVEHISRRILVMYLGKVVEAGKSRDIIHKAQHPYTKALISAVPAIEPGSQRRRIVLGGEMPSPLDPPAGCAFHPRCPMAKARCRTEAPELRELAPEQRVACHFAQ